MADVVLITSPIVFSKNEVMGGDEKTNPWMGVLYLASSLESKGFSVKIYDPGAEKLSLREIIERLKKDKPKVIGLSSLTSGIKSAVEIAKTVKRCFKDEMVVGIGGSHINVDPTFINRFPYFDFSVAGDGEITLTKIVDKVLGGKKLKQNIFQGERVQNLDELPLPARHLINIRNYFPIEQEGSNETPTAAIVGSRGCTYLCSFCSRNSQWRNVRFRSAKNILKEMESIAQNYDGKFSFTDDAITMNRKIMMELCDMIVKRRNKFHWLGMTRCNLVDDELLKRMRKAGCEELFFGIESGNPRVRNGVIRKNLSDVEIKKAMELCRKDGIRTSVFLMMGFPTETKDELEDTVNFGLKFQPDFIGVHQTLILPGSEIFEIAKRENYIPSDLVDRYASGKLGDGFVGKWPVYLPKGISMEYVIAAKKRAYRKFYLNPNWIFRRIILWFKDKNTFLHDLSLIETGIYVLIFGHSRNAFG